jgi:hypothetical protein
MGQLKLAPQTPQSSPSAQAGNPLPASLRHQMESSFGTDFSSVRVHEGHQATHVGAQAYTQGQDIHFAPGAYQPGNDTGRQLIAHELTHVVQQGAIGPNTVPSGMVEVDAAPSEAE